MERVNLLALLYLEQITDIRLKPWVLVLVLWFIQRPSILERHLANRAEFWSIHSVEFSHSHDDQKVCNSRAQCKLSGFAKR